ncbi:MAG: sigma-70 family RNA polymerase sigma factor [Chitinophagales bacterium]|nr:sigma-70 family RNA polymerase sigma factor [Chitinophagales bacterium]
MAVFGSKLNSGLTDEELISKYRFSHDNSYLGELFLRYLPSVFGVALGVLKNQKEAEDLTMTVFHKIASDLKRIEVKDFSSWLYQLTKNLCTIESKKKNAGNNDSKNILIDELASKDDHELFINASEDKTSKIDANNLRLAINTLNENQKICIDLFYMQNKSYQEVAESTGFSVNQVKTNIQNGKRLLKTYLENRGL